MLLSGKLYELPKQAKYFLLCFLLVLSFGYFMGFSFVKRTTSLTSTGIEQNYNGNEEVADEEVDEYLFKKPEKEILTIVHNHVLSMSIIFLITGLLILLTNLPGWVKGLLTIEPMISLVVTFGGIYIMWLGNLWMKYVIMVSGILLTLSYVTAIILLIWHLLFVKSDSNS